MSLKIDYDINLSDEAINIDPLVVEQGVVISETDSSLRMYYIHDSTTSDKTSILTIADYGNLSFKDLTKHLTSRTVSKIGIKTFPGMGSYGFFRYKYEQRSVILCPINNNPTQFTAPMLTMETTAGGKLKFTIKDPQDITYECYRIILRNERFALEYVTYNKTIEVPKPDVNGTYIIYCIGYVREGEHISFDSNVLNLIVTGGRESFAPIADYYTAEQVSSLISGLEDRLAKLESDVGNIDTILDDINGVEV